MYKFIWLYSQKHAHKELKDSPNGYKYLGHSVVGILARHDLPLQLGPRSTQEPLVINVQQLRKCPVIQLSEDDSKRHSPLPSPPPLHPAFDGWLPANHQQIGQCLGHITTLALTEPFLSLEPRARSGRASFSIVYRLQGYSTLSFRMNYMHYNNNSIVTLRVVMQLHKY